MADGSPSPLPLAERMRRRMGGDVDVPTATRSGDVVAPAASSSSATKAGAAAASASSAASSALAALLAELFERASTAAAIEFLTSAACSRAQRRQMAELACLEEAWRDCDQSIPGNVSDLASALCSELYEPFWFYRSNLLGGEKSEQPRSLFCRGSATAPLSQRNKDKYWMASSRSHKYAWLETGGAATFDAVVHFVQAGSGTGVHIGDGRVLTCAHVIDCRDDDHMDEGDIPDRHGRKKVLMFASGRTFIAECAAVQETSDGIKDVAMVVLGAEVDVSSLPTSHGEQATGKSSLGQERQALATDTSATGTVEAALPVAAVAETPVALGEKLFCVGNPSNVDLESLAQGSIEFEPATWHASVGKCEGYIDPTVQAARDAQQARGRAPTRGELKSILEAPPVDATEGTYMQHSCWTYWGHSGAPLFNEEGQVTGLHCSWDDRTGARHGQKLQYLLDAMASAGEAAAPNASNRTKGVRTSKVKRRRKA
eukprot:COSAG02_NODE_7586_length_2947_cov_2.376404_2_plen_486_part_00